MATLDEILSKYQASTATLAEEKLKNLAKAAQEKTQRIGGVDSGESSRLNLLGEGYSTDTFSTDAAVYSDPARLKKDQIAYGDIYRREPSSVLERDLVNAANARERQKVELKKQGHSDAEIEYWLNSKENNTEYNTPANQGRQLEDFASGQSAVQEVYNRPKTVGETAGDITAQAALSIPKMVVDTGLLMGEAAGNLNPFDQIARLVKKESAFQFLDRKLSLTEGAKNIYDDVSKKVLSGVEQIDEDAYQRRTADFEASTPQRVKGRIAAGESPVLAETKEQLNNAAFQVGELINNPGRAVSMISQSAASLFAGGLAARGALNTAIKKVEVIDRNWINNPKLVEQVNKSARRAGLAGNAGMEGIMAAASAREKVLTTDPKELEKTSETYRNYIAKGYSPEQARAELAKDVTGYTFVGMVALAGLATKLTSMDTLSAKMFGGQIAGKTVDRVQRGITERAVRGTAKTAVDMVPETIEESAQGLAEQFLNNLTTQQYIDPNQSLVKGIGTAAGQGAVAGAGTMGIAGGARNVAGGVRNLALGQPTAPMDRPQGTLTAAQGVNLEQVKPELKAALENTGMDLVVNSGYRDPKHNASVGGAKQSRHMRGDAVDISLAGMPDPVKKNLLKLLAQNGIATAITYTGDNYLHVDMVERNEQPFSLLHDQTAAKLDQAPTWAKEAFAEIKQGKLGTNQTNPNYTGTFRVDRTTNVEKTPIAQAISRGISKAVRKHNVPPLGEAYLRAIAEIESSQGKQLLGEEIKSGIHQGDRAKGPYQFMTKTAQAYGLTDPNDPDQSADAAARHFLDAYNTQRKLAESRGEKVTEDELMRRAALGHHSGPGWTEENLGSNGKAYAAKLAQTVGKYLSKGAVTGGGTTLREATPQSIGEAFTGAEENAELDSLKLDDLESRFNELFAEAESKDKTLKSTDIKKFATLYKVGNKAFTSAVEELKRLDENNVSKESEQHKAAVERARTIKTNLNRVSAVGLADVGLQGVSTLGTPDTVNDPNQYNKVNDALNVLRTTIEHGNLQEEKFDNVPAELKTYLETRRDFYKDFTVGIAASKFLPRKSSKDPMGVMDFIANIDKAHETLQENPEFSLSKIRDNVAGMSRFLDTQKTKLDDIDKRLQLIKDIPELADTISNTRNTQGKNNKKAYALAKTDELVANYDTYTALYPELEAFFPKPKDWERMLRTVSVDNKRTLQNLRKDVIKENQMQSLLLTGELNRLNYAERLFGSEITPKVKIDEKAGLKKRPGYAEKKQQQRAEERRKADVEPSGKDTDTTPAPKQPEAAAEAPVRPQSQPKAQPEPPQAQQPTEKEKQLAKDKKDFFNGLKNIVKYTPTTPDKVAKAIEKAKEYVSNDWFKELKKQKDNRLAKAVEDKITEWENKNNKPEYAAEDIKEIEEDIVIYLKDVLKDQGIQVTGKARKNKSFANWMRDIFTNDQLKIYSDIVKQKTEPKNQNESNLWIAYQQLVETGVKIEEVIPQAEQSKSEPTATTEPKLSTTAINAWDLANRNRRNDVWFEGGKANPAAISGFTEAAQNGASNLQAHGMAKESTLTGGLQNLIKILQNGLDSKRRNGELDTAPLTSEAGAGLVGATASGNAYSEGPFILVAKPGQKLSGNLEGLGAILINQENINEAQEITEHIKSIRPNLLVGTYSDAGKITKELLKNNSSEPKIEVTEEAIAKTTIELDGQKVNLLQRINEYDHILRTIRELEDQKNGCI